MSPLFRASTRPFVRPLFLAQHLAARLQAVALTRRRRHGSERAQSTVEYALILLGAAAIALVVVAWVTRSDAIGRLFDTVLGRVLSHAS